MARPEHTDGNSSELTIILQRWNDMIKVHQTEHSMVHDWGGLHPIYIKDSRAGEAMIANICSQIGLEATRSLVDDVSNLGLTTQLQIMMLAGSEAQEARILSEALSGLALGKTSPNESNWPDHYLEERAYREVLTKMLEIKFPDEKLEELIKLLPEAKDVLKDGTSRTQAMEALKISLRLGPNKLISSLDFIPLEQLSDKNFAKRLAIEKSLSEQDSVPVQREYIFRGQVQDVGFRAQCRSVARRWGLRGFARNEFDGSVTVVVQGYPELINTFLEDFSTHARENMRISFDREDGEEVVIEKELGGFSIEDAVRPLEQSKRNGWFLRLLGNK